MVCPKCGTELQVTTDYEEDEVFGASVEVEVYCSKCDDRRCDSFVDVPEFIENLINKVGT